MIFVIATVQVHADKRDRYLAGARACVAATRAENGCISYDLTASISDPNAFVFVERWTSREALGAHFEADHLKAWRKIAAECIARPTVVEIIFPANIETL
jgi:quinol monooxygenase YgiN